MRLRALRRSVLFGLVVLLLPACINGINDASEPTLPFTSGAAGIGDSFYPELGNGGYDVEQYGIDLVYHTDGTVEADVDIDAIATQNLSAFNLDFVGWEIEQLTVDGDIASHRRDGDEIVIRHVVPSGDHFEIKISYHGTPESMQSAAMPPGSGGSGWLAGPSGEQFVVAEPDAAHSWFPANDHPIDKATYSFAVTVPTGFVAAANGELTEIVEGDGTTTYHWSMDVPMASYLATVVIGDGWHITEDAISTEEAGVLIRNMLPPDLVGDVPAALERTGEMIGVLEEAFGPYPFDRYGIAVVGGYSGALENQTLSVFGRGTVEGPFFDFIHVHELAHQWFGNSISVAQWGDIWLNEGFATFAELLWVEHLYGAGAYREEAANRTEEARVGYGPPGTPPREDLFNGTVYLRGALVLVALRDEVGDEAFFETLRTYTERYANSNATTENFIAIAEEVSRQDLDGLFATWLYGEELPN